MEAMAWLRSAALLVESASLNGGFFFVSRRGKTILSSVDFATYRKAVCCREHSFTRTLQEGYIPLSCAANMTPSFFRFSVR